MALRFVPLIVTVKPEPVSAMRPLPAPTLVAEVSEPLMVAPEPDALADWAPDGALGDDVAEWLQAIVNKTPSNAGVRRIQFLALMIRLRGLDEAISGATGMP